MKKRFVTLLLCTAFTFSCLTGCGNSKPEEVSVPDTAYIMPPSKVCGGCRP